METHDFATSFGSFDYSPPGGERPIARRLANVFTAAAFQNRLIAGSFDRAPDDFRHDAWADAWDRVAALVRSARDRTALARLAADLRREALEGDSGEWRAVCAHAATELSQLTTRPR